MSTNCTTCGKPEKYQYRTSAYSVSEYGDDEAERPSLDSSRSLPRPQLAHMPSSIKSLCECGVRNQKFYKPNSNRTAVLTLFLLAFGLSIFLLEVAIAVHPDQSQVQGVRKRAIEQGQDRVFQARQAETLTASSLDTSTPTNTLATDTGTFSTPTLGQPPSSDMITITTASSASSVTPGQPPPSDLLTIATSPSVSTVNGNPATSQQVPSTQPSPSQGKEEGSNGASLEQNTSAAVLSTNIATSQSLSSETRGSALSSESILDAATSVSASVLESQGFAAPVDTVSIASQDAFTTSENGNPTTTAASTGQIIQTDGNGIPTTTLGYGTAPSGASATETGTAINSDNSGSSPDGTHIFTKFDYFLAMYLPTLIGVVLQSAWLIVFAAFKMMEPFYQLARPEGAPAATTLTADYLSSGLSTKFVKAVGEGHWVMFTAGLIQLLLGVIVTLVSEAMSVKATAYCQTTVSDHQPCNPVWIVNLGVVRAIEMCLIACFSMTLMVMLVNRHRVSGVFTDPTRIATVSDLLVHPPLIQQMRDLPSQATSKQIESELAASRYMLGTFEMNGQQKYGIIKLNDIDASRSAKDPRYKSTYSSLKTLKRSFEDLVTSRSKTLPFLPDAICMSLTVALFAIILAYWCVFSGSFNDWMNSGHIGPSMFLTALGVLIAYFIKRKEQLLRLSHPYILLSKRPSKPASETVLAGTRGTQFTSMYNSFGQRDLSLAFMSSAAILSDLLLIMIPGVPFTEAQTSDVYKVSTWSCLVILILMLIAQTRTTYKDWRRKSRLYDDCPETLASVLIRLCGSKFIEEKNDVQGIGASGKEVGMSSSLDFTLRETYEQKQKTRYEGINGEKRYTFALIKGVDGVSRHTVDEDLRISVMGM